MVEKCSSKRSPWVLLGILVLTAPSAAGAFTWARSFGGPGRDTAADVLQTSDGGIVVAGVTESFGFGGKDAWLLKLDNRGHVLWERTYGGPGDETAALVRETRDGKLVLAGIADYSDGAGQPWLLGLDAEGAVEWEKRYDSPAVGWVAGLEEDPGGGYLLGWGVDDVGFALMGLGPTGSLRWHRVYSSPDNPVTAVVRPTADGGCVAGGASLPVGGSEFEAWFLKIDAAGAIQWQKIFGTPGLVDQVGVDIHQLPDGEFVASGYPGVNGWNSWSLRLSATGDLVWGRQYVGQEDDWGPHLLLPLADRGFLMVGATQKAWGVDDIWVLRLNHAGGVLWQRGYGGFDPWQPQDPPDAPSAVAPTDDGGYLVAGLTATFGAGEVDALVLKLDEVGLIDPTCPYQEVTERSWEAFSMDVRDGNWGTGSLVFTERDVVSQSGPSEAVLHEECSDARCPLLTCWEVVVDDDTVCEATEQTFEVRYGGGEWETFVEWDLDGDAVMDAEGNPLTVSLPAGTWVVLAVVTDSCLLPDPQFCSERVVVDVSAGPPPEVSDVATGDHPLRVLMAPGPRIQVQSVPKVGAYNVYADRLGSWHMPSPATGSVCGITNWWPGALGTAFLDYDVPPNSWVVVTASNPCGEGPAGGDSAGVERTSVGDWTLCGEAP